MSADDPLLAREVNTRATIYDMPRDATFEQLRTSIPDAGRRRLLSWGMDFDTRAMTLGMKIEEHWDAQVKQLWAANQENIRTSLIAEFGEQAIDQKVENFSRSVLSRFRCWPTTTASLSRFGVPS